MSIITYLTKSTTSSMCCLWPLMSSSSSSRMISTSFSWSPHIFSTFVPYWSSS